MWCWWHMTSLTELARKKNLAEELQLKLGRRSLWSVVSQERNHQTLQRRDKTMNKRSAIKAFELVQLKVLYAPWLSTSCSLLQGKRGSGMSRKPGRPLPPFFSVDNAGRSSQVWPRLLSISHSEKISTYRNNWIEHTFNCISILKKRWSD